MAPVSDTVVATNGISVELEVGERERGRTACACGVTNAASTCTGARAALSPDFTVGVNMTYNFPIFGTTMTTRCVMIFLTTPVSPNIVSYPASYMRDTLMRLQCSDGEYATSVSKIVRASDVDASVGTCVRMLTLPHSFSSIMLPSAMRSFTAGCSGFTSVSIDRSHHE